MVSRICPICKKHFEVEIKRVNAGQGKYCSNSCAGKDKNRKPITWVLIPLTKNQFAKVDVEDIPKLQPYGWFAQETTYGTYRAVAHINGKIIKMHRFIMDAPDNKDVHHKNEDTLDNRKYNLFVCSRSEHFKIDGKHKPPIFYGDKWRKKHGKGEL